MDDYQLTADVFTDVPVFTEITQPQQTETVLIEAPPEDTFVFPVPEIPVVEDVPQGLTAFEQHVVDLIAAGDFDPFNGSYTNTTLGFGIDQDLFWAVSWMHNDLDAAGIAPEDYAATATAWLLQ